MNKKITMIIRDDIDEYYCSEDEIEATIEFVQLNNPMKFIVERPCCPKCNSRNHHIELRDTQEDNKTELAQSCEACGYQDIETIDKE